MKKKLGFIPKIIGFCVWVLGFIPIFICMGLIVGMKPIPKAQTQFFLGVNVCKIGQVQYFEHKVRFRC